MATIEEIKAEQAAWRKARDARRNDPKVKAQKAREAAARETQSDYGRVEYGVSYEELIRRPVRVSRPTVDGPITARQAAYIRRLLARRVGNAGFSGIAYSIESGKTRIESLTKAQASEVIESLTENY